MFSSGEGNRVNDFRTRTPPNLAIVASLTYTEMRTTRSATGSVCSATDRPSVAAPPQRRLPCHRISNSPHPSTSPAAASPHLFAPTTHDTRPVTDTASHLAPVLRKIIGRRRWYRCQLICLKAIIEVCRCPGNASQNCAFRNCRSGGYVLSWRSESGIAHHITEQIRDRWWITWGTRGLWWKGIHDQC